jgi:hypothetical protein
MQQGYHMIGYELKLTYTKEIAYRNTVSIPVYPESIFKDSRSDGKQRTGGYCQYYAIENPESISQQIVGRAAPGMLYILYNKKIYDWKFESDII